jgi:hypothetical protein
MSSSGLVFQAPNLSTVTENQGSAFWLKKTNLNRFFLSKNMKTNIMGL